MTDPTQAGAGNQAKYQSWRLAHERIDAAMAAGFPLEAVAIAESLITDRLLSFANFHGAGFHADKTTLRPVAEKVAKICQETTQDAHGQALAIRAQEWASQRNAVLHAIAKSAQGTGPQIAAAEFVEKAHAVALSGNRATSSGHTNRFIPAVLGRFSHGGALDAVGVVRGQLMGK